MLLRGFEVAGTPQDRPPGPWGESGFRAGGGALPVHGRTAVYAPLWSNSACRRGVRLQAAQDIATTTPDYVPKSFKRLG